MRDSANPWVVSQRAQESRTPLEMTRLTAVAASQASGQEHPRTRASRAAANVEFGTAPLSCEHLLVTSADALRVIDVDVAGAPVPWR